MLDGWEIDATVYSMKTTHESLAWWGQIMLVAAGVTLISCLPGCYSAGGGPYSDEEILNTKTTALPSGRCDINDVFDPGPVELKESVIQAAQLWEAALGRPICVQDGGLPIELAFDVKGETDHQICGFTSQYWHTNSQGELVYWAWNLSIQVRQLDDSLDCVGYDRVVLHEMGHALARRKDHTNTGLMSPYATDQGRIDQEAIDYVCRDTPCF